MNDYILFRVDAEPCSTDITDVAAALLADIGFESFEPDGSGLNAYIRSKDFDESKITEALSYFPFENIKLTTSKEFVAGQDWNSEWEKNYFRPIVVGGRCAIHSSFHKDVPKCEYDIVIDPKMAFGTGHHATTSLITEQLLEMDLTGKSVIDMGTGTGILAILAAMRGATTVTGIEIDPPAYENAIENVKLNGHSDIKLICGDASDLKELEDSADVFLANINRNVITGDIDKYAKAMKPGAVMLLSGFYVEDIPIVEAAATKAGLETDGYTERDRWTCLRLHLTDANNE